MRSRSGLALLVLALLTGCARVQAPPGGPADQLPPRIIATLPDSLGIFPGFKQDVEFRFDEVVAEGSSPNFGLGTGDLEKLVILSPSASVPEVHWRRSRITVRPREGWRPNTVYRVELLAGIADLAGNRTKAGSVVSFSTGAPLPTFALRGRVVDWTTQRPLPRGLVEAVLLPDSLPYRTTADSAGRFVLGPLPAGSYLVYAAQDQNNDFRVDPAREPFDSVPISAGRDSVGELWVFRHDTTAVRIASAAPGDSLSVLLTFTQNLNPYQALPPDSVELRLLPDSTRVPVVALVTKERYDSLFPVERPVDTTAAGRARADSLRADSLARARADSIRADSIARAQEAVRIRIPGVERRRQATADTAGTGPLRSKPPLFDKLYVRVREPLRPGASYAVTVHAIQNLNRISGTPKPVAFKVPEAKAPADTTKKIKPPGGGGGSDGG